MSVLKTSPLLELIQSVPIETLDILFPLFIRSIVGGIISLLILLVIVFLAYWVYSDARDRGSNHAFAWGIAVLLLFLMGLLPGIVVFVLYLIIRDDL